MVSTSAFLFFGFQTIITRCINNSKIIMIMERKWDSNAEFWYFQPLWSMDIGHPFVKWGAIIRKYQCENHFLGIHYEMSHMMPGMCRPYSIFIYSNPKTIRGHPRFSLRAKGWNVVCVYLMSFFAFWISNVTNGSLSDRVSFVDLHQR